MNIACFLSFVSGRFLWIHKIICTDDMKADNKLSEEQRGLMGIDGEVCEGRG